jgi:hypothetical protein
MAKSRELHCGKAKHKYPLAGFAVKSSGLSEITLD